MVIMFAMSNDKCFQKRYIRRNKLQNMKSDLVKAIGNFLAFYESDLNYIKRFHEYKRLGDSAYFDKSDYSLPSFLSEFKIARNIAKNEQERLMEIAQGGYLRKGSIKVNDFALEIQASGISNGKLTVSLASKVLFLNSPYKVMPYDSRTKKAVQYGSNEYVEFLKHLADFSMRYKEDVQLCLKGIRPYAITIERKFKELESLDLHAIRRNRMLDKLLWVRGRKKKIAL